MKKNYVLTPGPTQIPPEVLAAEAQPSMHHRTSEFSAIFKRVSENLQKLHMTQHPVLTFACSGSGGFESAIVNTLSPGDKVININSGKFGERWGEMAQVFGMDVTVIDVEWGQSVDVDQIAKLLKAHPETKAVTVTYSETSTATLNDVKALSEVVSATDTLLIVDSITGTAIHELRMDEWKLDVVVTGSQKGMMMAPGLAFVAIGPRALAACEQAKCPRLYWDWQDMLKNLKADTTAFTPAVSLVRSADVALEMILKEGLENVWARHQRLGEATRQALQALGFKLLSSNPSNVCTAAYIPEGVTGGKFTKYLREEQGVVMAAGQGHLKDKIIRIGHCGYVNEYDILIAIGAVEHGMAHFGLPVELGKGVAAVSKFFNS